MTHEKKREISFEISRFFMQDLCLISSIENSGEILYNFLYKIENIHGTEGEKPWNIILWS